MDFDLERYPNEESKERDRENGGWGGGRKRGCIECLSTGEPTCQVVRNAARESPRRKEGRKKSDSANLERPTEDGSKLCC